MPSDPYFWLILIVVLTVNLRRRRKAIIAMPGGPHTIATPVLMRPREGNHAANPKER